jgi:predicted acyltransferase
MKEERLISVDVFRGLIIALMILVNYPGSWKYMYAPLVHSDWNGLTPTDFIFPFFIFIVGVSIALSYSKQIAASKSRMEMVKKILIRGLKIYTIGFCLHYLPNFDLTKIDLFGVLQRIAEVFVVGALLFIFTSWRTQIYIVLVILVGYWLTMSFVSTDSFLVGTLEPGVNFAAWVDLLLFPINTIGDHGWNAEGFYSSLPAISSCILGMLAGQYIIDKKNSEYKFSWLILAGVVFILAGYIWGWVFPINKKIWTSSFVLVTSGWAVILFSIALFLIDQQGYKNNWLSKIGVIFGSNAIVIYVCADLFETIYKHSGIHDFVYLGLINFGLTELNASLIWSLCSVFSCYIIGLLLYRKKLFFKI